MENKILLIRTWRLGTLALALILPFGPANGQMYSVLKEFSTANSTGFNPWAPLLRAPDGALYGTTAHGGSAGCGTVFRVNLDGTGYTVLWHFARGDGSEPQGLVLNQGTLYGITRRGGSSDNGVVFKLNTNGTGYTVLKHFTEADGTPSSPVLALSAETLYGTTSNGGAGRGGTVFKLNTNGTGYSVLSDLTDAGAWTPGGIILLSNTLYGTTEFGGDYYGGAVFRLNTDGTGLTVLYSFGSPTTDGRGPCASLASDGNWLYGATSYGGVWDSGTLFKVQTSGAGYTVLKEFAGEDGGPVCGQSSVALMLSNNVLYGVAAGGGRANHGTAFRVDIGGAGFTVLKHFTGADGGEPLASLLSLGDTLYGTTYEGGAFNYGTLFQLKVDGSAYRVLNDFTGSGGNTLCGAVLLAGDTLYATTCAGGLMNLGTIFKINTNGSDYIVLKDFTGLDGAGPSGDLLLSANRLYGTAGQGGISNGGTVFGLNTDGTGFLVLKDFTNSLDGTCPSAGLVLSGSTLYGTTRGGGRSDCGTLFKLNTDGTGFSVLKDFTNSLDGNGLDGDWPYARLVLGGNKLYGCTIGGGSSYDGLVFSLNTDGSDYTVLRNFTNSPDGADPYGGLALDGSTLYGTTEAGGPSTAGTVFKLRTDGAGYQILKNFTGADGSLPLAPLLFSNGTLYGTTETGGSSDFGTVFKVSQDGTGFAVLKHFTGPDGRSPHSALVLSGSTLYGTTSAGGSSDGGAIFKIDLAIPVQTALSPVAVFNGAPVIVVTGPAGQPVEIQVATNFPGTWNALTNLTLTNGAGQFTDRAARNFPARFYRARSK